MRWVQEATVEVAVWSRAQRHVAAGPHTHTLLCSLCSHAPPATPYDSLYDPLGSDRRTAYTDILITRNCLLM